jgi:hypothetical protein
MSIQTAVRQFHVGPEHAAENGLFQLANCGIFGGQLEVRTTVFTQDGEQTALIHLDLKTSVPQCRGQLIHAIGKRATRRDCSELLDERVFNSAHDPFAYCAVLDILHLAPEDLREFRVIVAELAQAGLRHAIDMMGPSTTGANEFTRDHLQRLQPDQPLPHCGGRYFERGADFLDGSTTERVESLQELPITRFHRRLHSITSF